LCHLKGTPQSLEDQDAAGTHSIRPHASGHLVHEIQSMCVMKYIHQRDSSDSAWNGTLADAHTHDKTTTPLRQASLQAQNSIHAKCLSDRKTIHSPA
jgi:hypothetical protein